MSRRIKKAMTPIQILATVVYLRELQNLLTKMEGGHVDVAPFSWPLL